MVLKILLLISILLQLVAVIIALRLVRKTKFNLSWILFTIALTAMSVIRLGEYGELSGDEALRLPPYLHVWLGVVTSLCFAVGMIFVRKIFKWIEELNFQRRLTDRRILNTVLRTEEKERMRFSKELHDGLGPLLSSARMSLSVLKKRASLEADTEVIANTSYAIEEAIRSLREISNNLSPHILNDFGLGRGVANFISRMPAGEVKIDYSTNLRGERFHADVEVILYRVICELVNNSVKHSGGSAVRVSLDYDGTLLTLHYTDNGRGFDPSAMMDVGMGLSNISSRISSLKGSYEIKSSPGKGMEVHIEVNPTLEYGRGEI